MRERVCVCVFFCAAVKRVKDLSNEDRKLFVFCLVSMLWEVKRHCILLAEGK